ncbi:MAG: hypothetical protein R2799_14440 [Crocinitomicaceae bacterium]
MFIKQYLSTINLFFTIVFIFLAFVNHDLEKEWRFILAIEVGLFLNLARLTILENRIYKTQQYLISTALVGLLIFNILILKNAEVSSKAAVSIEKVHYPTTYFILNILFIVVLILNPKNQES